MSLDSMKNNINEINKDKNIEDRFKRRDNPNEEERVMEWYNKYWELVNTISEIAEEYIGILYTDDVISVLDRVKTYIIQEQLEYKLKYDDEEEV